MYQPSLFFNEFTLSVKGNPLANPKEFCYYKLHNLYEPVNKQNDIKHSISPQIFFENIGYGIANKIEYTWDFDYNKAIKILCGLTSDIQIAPGSKKESVVLIKNGDFFRSYNFDDLGKKMKIDFIKPENLQINKKPSSIPMIITSIHMDYLLIKNKMTTYKCKRFKYENYIDFPKPKLSITYEDIARKKYKSTYKFDLSCGNSFLNLDEKNVDTKGEYAFLTFKSE